MMQNIFWNTNIKFLRNRRKWSQEYLAHKLLITRSKLNALENGQTKNPNLEDLVLFSTFFKIPIDVLIKIDLSSLSPYHLHELEQGESIYLKGERMRVLAMNVDQNNEELRDYIPINAQAGYSNGGFSDPTYIAQLPKFNLPQLPKHGTFRMFPIKGDSMLPIPSGSDIIASYLEDWKSLVKPSLAIAILNGIEDIVFKEIVLVEDKGHFIMRSLNPDYEDYKVQIEDVKEIWKFYAYVTQELPELRDPLQEIFKKMEAIERKIK